MGTRSAATLYRTPASTWRVFDLYVTNPELFVSLRGLVDFGFNLSGLEFGLKLQLFNLHSQS